MLNPKIHARKVQSSILRQRSGFHTPQLRPQVCVVEIVVRVTDTER
jgi:hypothetical protein